MERPGLDARGKGRTGGRARGEGVKRTLHRALRARESPEPAALGAAAGAGALLAPEPAQLVLPPLLQTQENIAKLPGRVPTRRRQSADIFCYFRYYSRQT